MNKAIWVSIISTAALMASSGVALAETGSIHVGLDSNLAIKTALHGGDGEDRVATGSRIKVHATTTAGNREDNENDGWSKGSTSHEREDGDKDEHGTSTKKGDDHGEGFGKGG